MVESREPVDRAKIYRKVGMAIVATFVTIALVLLAPVAVVLGFSLSAVIVFLVLAGAALILLFLMDVIDSDIGVKIGVAISAIASIWAVVNLWLGR